jgi:hypothetical protein
MKAIIKSSMQLLLVVLLEVHAIASEACDACYDNILDGFLFDFWIGL